MRLKPPKIIRRLMPIECWRLQGFTDEQFYKAESTGLKDGSLYKMAGNAVSVPVLSAIGGKIKEVDEKYNITGENHGTERRIQELAERRNDKAVDENSR